MALPGGHGTFIIENTVFKNSITFENSHHCELGKVGRKNFNLITIYPFF